MPLNQLLMHVANCSNIYFNLSLFQYLDKHTIQNIGKSYIRTYIHIMNNIVALRPIDRKKNRKRNLISANVGLLMLGFMLVNVTIQCNLHIWELNLGRLFRLSKSKSKSKILHSVSTYFPGLRQFITSIIYDLAMCIITPSVVFYNAPVVRRQYCRWEHDNHVY